MERTHTKKVVGEFRFSSGLPCLQDRSRAVAYLWRFHNALAGLLSNQLLQSFTVEKINMTPFRLHRSGSIIEP